MPFASARESASSKQSEVCELYTVLTDPTSGATLWGSVGPHSMTFLDTSNYIDSEKRYFHGYQYGKTYDERYFQTGITPGHSGS